MLTTAQRRAVWARWMAANTEPCAVDKHAVLHAVEQIDTACAADPSAAAEALAGAPSKDVRDGLPLAARLALVAAVQEARG